MLPNEPSRFALMCRAAALVVAVLSVGDATAADAPQATTSAAPNEIGECKGSDANAEHIAIQFEGAANQAMRDLIRIKNLKVSHLERISDAHVSFHLSCAPLAMLVGVLAQVSGATAKVDANGGFGIFAVKNGIAIRKLRIEAGKYAGVDDKVKAKQTLLRIVALSTPGDKGEVQADVGDEYHELGNVAMTDKDYVHAEQYYRARLVQMERAGDVESPNYAIAVSNVADAREYQDDFVAAKQLYERALALMEKQPGPLTLPNSVLILGTLADNALGAKRFDEAEAYAERAWKHLQDPQRSQWDSAEHALEFAGDVEAEMGRLGDKSETEKHYERALKLKQDRYGAESVETVPIRKQLIFAAQLQGKTERAAEYSEQQLAVAQKSGDRTSDAYVGTMYQLLAIYAHLGKSDRLIALWQRMLAARRALLGDDSPHVVAALRDLATLYRLDRQWSQAAAAEQRAATIKPVDDSAALKKLERLTQYAMQYDPGLSLWCMRIDLQAQQLADMLIPPIPPVPPYIFFDMPDLAKPEPPPKDNLAQARLFEQAGECTDAPSFTIHELERALRIRIVAQGDKNADTRATAERLIELYKKSGDTQSAERIRALSKE